MSTPATGTTSAAAATDALRSAQLHAHNEAAQARTYFETLVEGNTIPTRAATMITREWVRGLAHIEAETRAALERMHHQPGQPSSGPTATSEHSGYGFLTAGEFSDHPHDRAQQFLIAKRAFTLLSEAIELTRETPSAGVFRANAMMLIGAAE